MKPIHCLIVASMLVLCGGEMRSEQVVLPAGTSLTVEDGMRIQKRATWIKERLSKFIVPNVGFENESLQDCLEYLRGRANLVLIRADETDNHIHFLRCGPSQEDVRISLKLTGTSILDVCEELAKLIGAKLHVVDYGVLFEVPLATGTNKSRDNPFE